MDNNTLDIVVGFVGSMIVLPIVQQPRWSATARWWVTFGFCMVCAVVSAALTGRLDGVDWRSAQQLAAAFVAVIGAAVTTYKGLGKGFGVSPMIERATSPSTPGRHSTDDD